MGYDLITGPQRARLLSVNDEKHKNKTQTLIITARHENHDDDISSVPLSVKLGLAKVTALLPSEVLMRTVPFPYGGIGGGTGSRSGFFLILKINK